MSQEHVSKKYRWSLVGVCLFATAFGCDDDGGTQLDAAPGEEAGIHVHVPDVADPDVPERPVDGAPDVDAVADSAAVDEGAVADAAVDVPDISTADVVQTDSTPPADAAHDGPLQDAAPDGPLPDGPLPDGPLPDGPLADGPLADGPLPDGPLPDVELDVALPDVPRDGALPDRLPLDLPLLIDDAPPLDLPLPDAQEPDLPLPDAQEPDLPLPDAQEPDAAPPLDPLAVDEIVPENRGTTVAADGVARPWLEVVAQGDDPVDLALWSLVLGEEVPWPLADEADVLEVGERRFLFLPFSVPRGAVLRLEGPDVSHAIEVPVDLPVDHALARFGGPLERCRWATPGAPNGDVCQSPAWPEPPVVQDFLSDPLPEVYPPRLRPLVITELGLHPAPGFVEILNAGDDPVEVADWSVQVAAQPAGMAWPEHGRGAELSWPVEVLAPGERVTLAVLPMDVADLVADPLFEGVVTLFDAFGEAAERVDFMHWPEGGFLAREGPDDTSGHHRFCAASTPDEVDSDEACEPLASRPIGDRVRHLRTPGDFGALAEGNFYTGTTNAKVVVDLGAGEVVHLLGNARWDLHYTFVREVIEGLPHMSRCIPAEVRVFNRGWSDFSRAHYFSDDRRYVLSTLYRSAANGVLTMEYTTGDRITPPLMKRAFLATMRNVQQHGDYALKPHGVSQHARYHDLEETGVPIVELNAHLRGATQQLLVPGVAYGWLRALPGDALDPAALGPDTILVTDEAPSDLPYVGGLLADRPQSPNADHLIRMLDRGAPSMSLQGVADDPRVAPFIDQFVRFEVRAGDFVITPAEAEEAEAWREAEAAERVPVNVVEADLMVRGVVPLAELGRASIASAGTHAAYIASLSNVESGRRGCVGALGAPSSGFALTVVHAHEHLVASGAAAVLPAVDAPRVERLAALAAVRDAIRAQPVDPAVLAAFSNALTETFRGVPTRLWPSSNAAGAMGFSGAGLYPPRTLAADPELVAIESALHDIWASQWSALASDERAFRGIEPASAALGVFVSAAPTGPISSNGNLIARNIYFPLRRDHVMSIQRGLAPVSSPAPGVDAEEIVYNTRSGIDLVGRRTWSSLSPGTPLLDNARMNLLACRGIVALADLQATIDPRRTNRWLAADISWWVPVEGEPRIERIRPMIFGLRTATADCREL